MTMQAGGQFYKNKVKPEGWDVIKALFGEMSFCRPQWCKPQDILPTLTFTDVGIDITLPNITFPSVFLPTGIIIDFIHLVIYFTKKSENSGFDNALSAANKSIRIMKYGGVSDIAAITLPNGGLHTVANGVEGGTIIEGTVDVKSIVDNISNTTYNVMCKSADCPTVTAASLILYDVIVGFKVYYTLG